MNAKERSLGVIAVVFLTILFFGIAGCEDDGPNAVGLSGIDTGQLAGNIKTDTLYINDIERDTSYMDTVGTSSSDRLYLGSIDNYDFQIAMRFTMPSEIESVTVTSAKLQLVTSASYGPAGTFTANVRTIRKEWTAGDLRWNRLTGAGDNGDIIAQATITNTPESGTFITINMPRDTIQHWVWAIKDTNRAKMNTGIIIEFSGANFVQQFYSANNVLSTGALDTNLVPRLDVAYQKFDPQTQTTTVDHIPVVPVNLTSGIYNQGFSGYIYRDRAPQSPNTLTVGGGVPYHALLKFNTSKIPSNATISLAKLIMKLDASGNYQYSSGDSLLLQALRVLSLDWVSGSLSNNQTDITYINPLSRFRSRLTDNLRNDSLTFNITHQLQDWATFPSRNFGVQIAHGDEVRGNFRSLYRVRFIRNISDRENSPKIIIFYTSPPEN